VVITNFNSKTTFVRTEVRTARNEILAEARADLQHIQEVTVLHHHEFAKIGENYARFCGELNKKYTELNEAQEDIGERIRQMVQDHDRNTLSKKMPAELIRSIGPTFEAMGLKLNS